MEYVMMVLILKKEQNKDRRTLPKGLEESGWFVAKSESVPIGEFWWWDPIGAVG